MRRRSSRRPSSLLSRVETFKPHRNHKKGGFMKKLFCLTALLATCLPLSTKAQEAPKAELFGGYSYLRVHPGEGGDNIGAHGFNTSLAGNVTRNFGLVAEFSRFTKSESFNLGDLFNQPGLGTAGAKARVSTYLFGPRLTLRTGSAEP